MDEIFLGRVEFAAVPLEDRTEFLSDAQDYRKAVEYLVQFNAIEFIRSQRLNVGVISRVDSPGYYKTLDFVKQQSCIVTDHLMVWLSDMVASNS